jgi:hypothetical protein
LRASSGAANSVRSDSRLDASGAFAKAHTNRQAKLFHYTVAPNKLTSGRDMPVEVAKRLERAGFVTELKGDGVLAVKK